MSVPASNARQDEVETLVIWQLLNLRFGILISIAYLRVSNKAAGILHGQHGICMNSEGAIRRGRYPFFFFFFFFEPWPLSFSPYTSAAKCVAAAAAAAVVVVVVVVVVDGMRAKPQNLDAVGSHQGKVGFFAQPFWIPTTGEQQLGPQKVGPRAAEQTVLVGDEGVG